VLSKSGFRGLEVWQLSMDLAVRIYDVTGGLPESERFGLTSQLRRAAVSVPSNIAEGHGRGPGRANASFLRVSKGSLNEVETLLELARRTGLLAEDPDIDRQLTRVGAMLNALIRSMPLDGVREEPAGYGPE
jgi:four helix bundle protein